MDKVISVLLGICVFSALVVGNTNGDPIEQARRPWSTGEIITLKSIKEMFARPKVLGGLVRGGFIQTAVAEDPNCPPGFLRGPRGQCREIW